MLVLVRKRGTAIYGGFDITEDLDSTYDHLVRVESVVDDLNKRSVTLSVTYADGFSENIILDANNSSIDLGDGIQYHLMGVRAYPAPGGRDQLAARIGVKAPKEYKVVRCDAIKRVA